LKVIWGGKANRGRRGGRYEQLSIFYCKKCGSSEKQKGLDSGTTVQMAREGGTKGGAAMVKGSNSNVSKAVLKVDGHSAMPKAKNGTKQGKKQNCIVKG